MIRTLLNVIRLWLWEHTFAPRYERLERYHFGDPVAKTGLYAECDHCGRTDCQLPADPTGDIHSNYLEALADDVASLTEFPR